MKEIIIRQSKKCLSLVIVALMIIGLVPLAAFAETSGTATEWTASNTSGPFSSAVLTITKADGSVITGKYDSILNACAAAGNNGKITIPAGIWYFDSIQDTKCSNITIEGATDSADDTKLVARTGQGGVDVSPVGFMGTLFTDWNNKGKAYNSKAVLRVGAGDTNIKNLTLDGGTFGSDSVVYKQASESSGSCDSNKGNPDFVVLRLNGNGDINNPTQVLLDNVNVIGYKSKTVIQVGTSSAYANVLAKCITTSKNGANYYAAIDTCPGSSLKTLDSWIEGFVLGDEVSLGKGYYKSEVGGLNGYITIVSAIDFYNGNSSSLAGMKTILLQNQSSGEMIVEAMINDLCDNSVQLYGYSCEEKLQLIKDFKTALSSLAADTDFDASEYISQLNVITKKGECHNFVEGYCSICGKESFHTHTFDENGICTSCGEIKFESVQDENIEFVINENTKALNEETGLNNIVELDESVKDEVLTDEQKAEINNEVSKAVQEIVQNEVVSEMNKSISVENSISSENEVAIAENVMDKYIENQNNAGHYVEKAELDSDMKLNIELKSVSAKKSVSAEEKTVEAGVVKYDIKPILVVKEKATGKQVASEVIPNDFIESPIVLRLAVPHTSALKAKVVHTSEDGFSETMWLDILGSDNSQYIEISMAHFSEVTVEPVYPKAIMNDLGQFTATIGDITKDKRDILSGFAKATTQTAYVFTPDPEDLSDDRIGTKYDKWNADFEVSFDKPVARNSVILVGSYEGYVDLGAFWPVSSPANVDFRLLKNADTYVNYGELKSRVKSFACGAVNLSDENIGTTMTVKLYMYESTGKIDPDGAKKVLIGEYKYTFSEKSGFTLLDGTPYEYSKTLSSGKGEVWDYTINQNALVPAQSFTFTSPMACFTKPVSIQIDKEDIADIKVELDEGIEAEVAQENIAEVLENNAVAKFSGTNIEKATTKNDKDAEKNLGIIKDELISASENNQSKALIPEIGDESLLKSIHIDPKAVSVSQVVSTSGSETVTSVIKKMSFDVKPWVETTIYDSDGEVIEVAKAVIPNNAITTPITFRLPVDKSIEKGTIANVYHEGDYIGRYAVQEENGDKFIELASDHFSVFSYELEEDIAISPDDIVVSKSLTLKENIDVNFYVKIKEKTYAEDYTIVRTTTTTYGTNDASPVGLLDISTIVDGQFKFVADCAAAPEMGETVNVKIYYKGVLLKDIDYSVKQYCTNFLSDPEKEDDIKNLCRALLDYGACAQIYCKENEDDLVNDEYTIGTTIISSTTIYPSVSVNKVTGAIEGVTVSSSVVLTSGIQIKIYFTGIAPEEIGNYTFTVDSKEVDVEEAAGEYIVRITGLGAGDLDQKFTISASNGTDTLTKEYSVLSYTYSKQSSKTPGLADLVKALYLYSVAAEEYFK